MPLYHNSKCKCGPDVNSPVLPIMEMTSVTKLPRRVFTFSKKNLHQAIKYNDTGHQIHVSVNFADYVDVGMAGKRGGRSDLTTKFKSWLVDNISSDLPKNALISFIGTGPLTDDTIYIT